MSLPDNAATRREACKVVSDGRLIACRTDTFYGLGVNPLNRDAVIAVRNLKGREEDKPILLLVSDFEMVERFVAGRSAIFNEISKTYWPGPITLVTKSTEDLPEELTAGTGTIGVRLPCNELVRDLV